MAAILNDMKSYVDFGQPAFWISAASIIFNPTFWNIAARSEYHNKTITNFFNNNSFAGCYALAATIFSLGIARDAIFKNALDSQPTYPPLVKSPYTVPVAYLLLGIGNTLVLSSMWALGITGTYLGDYFGILMDEPVTGFPFNVSGAPMYWGSTCSFVGTSLLFGKPAGVVLSFLVWFCYRVALEFEDPFTEMIYRKRDEERKRGKGSGTAEKKSTRRKAA